MDPHYPQELEDKGRHSADCHRTFGSCSELPIPTAAMLHQAATGSHQPRQPHTTFSTIPALPQPAYPPPIHCIHALGGLWAFDRLAINPQSVCTYDLLPVYHTSYFPYGARQNHDGFPLRRVYALLTSAWRILRIGPDRNSSQSCNIHWQAFNPPLSPTFSRQKSLSATNPRLLPPLICIASLTEFRITYAIHL